MTKPLKTRTELYLAKNGEFGLRRKSGNGRIIGDGGETFKTPASAWANVKRNGHTADDIFVVRPPSSRTLDFKACGKLESYLVRNDVPFRIKPA